MVFQRLFLVASLSFFALASHAEITDKYFGVARLGTLSGFNFELAGTFGSAYLIIGDQQGHGGFDYEDATFILGWRHYFDNRTLQNTWYSGVTAGDLDGTGSGSRYGIGGELGYQWISEYVRITASGSLAIVEEFKADAEGNSLEIGDDGEERRPREMEPILLWGLTVNLRK